MRRATKIIAASFGLFAGFGGMEHGYFEILQGTARPQSMMIASTGQLDGNPSSCFCLRVQRMRIIGPSIAAVLHERLSRCKKSVPLPVEMTLN